MLQTFEKPTAGHQRTLAVHSACRRVDFRDGSFSSCANSRTYNASEKISNENNDLQVGSRCSLLLPSFLSLFLILSVVPFLFSLFPGFLSAFCRFTCFPVLPPGLLPPVSHPFLALLLYLSLSLSLCLSPHRLSLGTPQRVLRFLRQRLSVYDRGFTTTRNTY